MLRLQISRPKRAVAVCRHRQVTAVEWAPSGDFLATASLDRTVRLWAIALDGTPAATHTLKVAISPQRPHYIPGGWTNRGRIEGIFR
eukprot:3427060-Pyramimonas_sp.AAC.1